MPPTVKNSKPLPFQILALAPFVVLTLFYVGGKQEFQPLWDEKRLSYSAQRVILVEVTIRDFMAYDPIRYYFPVSE